MIQKFLIIQKKIDHPKKVDHPKILYHPKKNLVVTDKDVLIFLKLVTFENDDRKF
jgi:hypothetical protein